MSMFVSFTVIALVVLFASLSLLPEVLPTGEEESIVQLQD
jgi:hypothetical protein